MNDMGPSYYADALPSAGNSSLGELSAHYKGLKGTTNARMLTNDDVQQMVANKNGVTVAKNMPPLGPGSLVQSGQAQQAGSQSATQNTQSTPQQEQNAANSQGDTTACDVRQGPTFWWRQRRKLHYAADQPEPAVE